MWNILKAAIAAVIKTNNNQEITGAILQNTLRQIVNSIGANATLAGFATPETSPGTPDGPVFWIAGPGYYNNFGNNQRTVTDSQLAFFIWNGDAWQFEVIDFAISSTELTRIESIAKWCQAQLDSLTAEDVTGPGVQSTQIAIALKKNIGSEDEPEWDTLSTVVFNQATTTKAGLMSANDKTTLNTLPNKQDKLVSGTNIKTINGTSILGSGRIDLRSILLEQDVTVLLYSNVYANIVINGKTARPGPGFEWDEEFKCGDLIKLQTVPPTGYIFTGWSIDGIRVEANPFVFTAVKETYDIMATFDNQATTTKQVTFQVSPASAGNITANNVSYSNNQSELYAVGTVLNLTASAQSGYTFRYWRIDGNVISSQTHSFTVSANHVIEALFEQNAGTESIQEIYYDDVQGNVIELESPSDTDGPDVPSGYQYEEPIGSTIYFMAQPKNGFIFDHWELDGTNVGSSNPYSLIVTTNYHQLRAVFAAVPSNLKVYLTSNTANTTVVIGSKQYVLTQNVETAVDYVDGMALTASNSTSGKSWIYWYNTVTDETNTSNPLTLTGLTADIHLSAIFN